MNQKILALVALARPRQWLKNLALFAPLVFSRHLFWPTLFWQTTLGAMAFCLLSSSNYILNDVIDAPRDRQHPLKKNRPVAARVISEKGALLTAVVLAIAGLLTSYVLGTSFLLVAVGFMVLHWASHFFLRHISIVDVLALAGGYVLRVVAGEMTSNYHISIWLLLTVLAFSLLLAIGKRRAELSLIKEHEDRSRLDPEEFNYSERLLDAYVAVFANATFLTYTYFTFLATPIGGGILSDFALWASRKWMMVTIPFVLYGILRYLQIIYEIKEETLEQKLIADLPLLVDLGLWTLVVLVVVYYL